MVFRNLLISVTYTLSLVSGATQNEDTQFHRAVRSGNYTTAEKLLENPLLNHNSQDGRGFTPLMYAAENDFPELMTLLIKANSNLNIQNNSGETALIIAVRNGRVDATRLLLMAGADTHFRDSTNLSAKDWANKQKKSYILHIINIASQPSVANIILAEKPIVSGSEHLEPPKITNETPPLYTESAFNRKVEGRVTLRAIIRKDGSMGPIRIHKTLDDSLDNAALQAVSSWRFKPATIDGTPINVLADIEIDFDIQQRMQYQLDTEISRYLLG